MKKNNYEFKDLFDADKSLSQEGKEARAKVSVSQLEQLLIMSSIAITVRKNVS